MRRVCTLATLSAVALSIGAGRAGAAHFDAPPVPAARADALGAVTALSVVPGDGRAEVVISLSGAVTVQDFTVDAPHRIVLDLSGARLARLERAYDRQPRGGITNIRMSQYRPDVVRIVLDLDAAHSYTVVRGTSEVRVSLTSADRFAAWHSRQDGPAVAAAARPVVPPAAVTSAASAGKVVPASDSVRDPRDVKARRGAEALDSVLNAAPVAAKEPPTIEAGRTDSDAAAPAPAPSKAPVALFSQQSQQPRLRVTWQDADIREVIAGFAEQTGRTIVVGKNVTGTVTAEIKDQPWDVAFKAILESLGLAAAEDPSGIITVDSYENILQKQASEPLSRQIVKLNYATAGSLVTTIKDLLSKDCTQGPSQVAAPSSTQEKIAAAPCLTRGSVAADSGTNALLITEVTSRLPDLLGYVKQLDVRTPQVNLKAKIISVNRTQIEQLGVSYDLGSAAAYFNTLLPRNKPGSESSVDDREGRITLGGDALAGVANAQRKFKNGSALNLLFSTALGKYSLTSFIDALHEQDLSDIQAEPSVTTLDNRQARILVGQETPVRVIDAGSAAQIGVPARANVQFKETGIILTVTPHITNNRQIRMTIEAEQSSLNIIGGDLGFNIDKRNATTQLLVNDGETAVIGGLTQTSIQKNRSGIPLLSELPLLGRLFSQTDTREVKQDLLIMITPHILDEGSAVRPPGGSN
jgi:type IV pilus assembly protein PilQ